MEAIKVIDERSSDVFEKMCNDLVQQGYLMQSCNCDFVSRNDYTPTALWFAIFALPEAVQKTERN